MLDKGFVIGIYEGKSKHEVKKVNFLFTIPPQMVDKQTIVQLDILD